LNPYTFQVSTALPVVNADVKQTLWWQFRAHTAKKLRDACALFESPHPPAPLPLVLASSSDLVGGNNDGSVSTVSFSVEEEEGGGGSFCAYDLFVGHTRE